MQLDFMWKELQGYSSVMKTLKSAKSILEASNAVLIGYERPANQSEAVQKQRAKTVRHTMTIMRKKTLLHPERSNPIA